MASTLSFITEGATSGVSTGALTAIDNDAAINIQVHAKGTWFSSIPNFRRGMISIATSPTDVLASIGVNELGDGTNYGFRAYQPNGASGYNDQQSVAKASFSDASFYSMIYHITSSRITMQVYWDGDSSTPLLDHNQAPYFTFPTDTDIYLSLGTRLDGSSNYRPTAGLDAIVLWDPTHVITAAEAVAQPAIDNANVLAAWGFNDTLSADTGGVDFASSGVEDTNWAFDADGSWEWVASSALAASMAATGAFQPPQLAAFTAALHATIPGTGAPATAGNPSIPQALYLGI